MLYSTCRSLHDASSCLFVYFFWSLFFLSFLSCVLSSFLRFMQHVHVSNQPNQPASQLSSIYPTPPPPIRASVCLPSINPPPLPFSFTHRPKKSEKIKIKESRPFPSGLNTQRTPFLTRQTFLRAARTRLVVARNAGPMQNFAVWSWIWTSAPFLIIALKNKKKNPC